MSQLPPSFSALLHGRYEFRKSPEAIDIDAIIWELSQLPITEDMDD